jgi:hypothetical protein
MMGKYGLYFNWTQKGWLAYPSILV